MMGTRHPLKGGDEYDAFTGWRRFLKFRAGDRSRIKAKFWRRVRKMMKGGVDNE